MVSSIAIVGGGVFGLAAASELARRGYRITVVDAGVLPRAEASSTDVSKAVRMDYGADELYSILAERAIEGWRAWNRRWGEELFHEDGMLMLSRAAMAPGGFEWESKRVLESRGHRVEPLDRARFSAWNFDVYRDGYYNPTAGWVESGRAISRLAEDACRGGVEIIESSAARLAEKGSHVIGVIAGDREIGAELTVVAGGAWTPLLLPEMERMMVPVAQPVLHFRPAHPERFRAPAFTTWAADISNTGWYGFPATRDGILKIGHHGTGRRQHPDAPRTVDAAEEARFRSFLAESLPGLESMPLAGSRLCFYCDSWDGNFFIDHHPDRPGLFVASGGSGHGFKFGPVLGPLIADAIEGRSSREAERFRWRTPQQQRYEDARYLG